MEYLIPIATCLLVAVVSSLLAYNYGRSVEAWENGQKIGRVCYYAEQNVETYSDDENEETTLFITLASKNVYPVTEIVLNDGESLRLYREERTV